MKYSLALILILALIAGCSPAPTATPEMQPTATVTLSPFPPTATSTVTPLPPTDTATPPPTPLPGKVVLPIDSLAKTIPWLPMDETARPVAHYVAFNTMRPPFNNSLVRQAFAYAVDRQVILEMAEKYHAKDPQGATTLTPPDVLGRDLYGDVGIAYDPEKARELFAEAGYPDASAFPAVTLIVNSYGDIAPGARFNMANTMAKMWKENLGVSVQVEALQPKSFRARLNGNTPEMFWLGWAADVNDPDNFLREIFRTGSQYNYGKFSNSEFDQLVDRAKQVRDPAQRQELYIQAERLLCEKESALLPLFHAH